MGSRYSSNNKSPFKCLKLEAWNFSGAWMLDVGAFQVGAFQE
jgi:hypothetical protein